MSVEALAAVFKHSEMKMGARLVMIGMANRADEHGIAWPDVKDLIVASRLGRSGVKGALKKCREAGEIVPVDDEENIGGQGRSTLYKIVLPGLDGEYTDDARSRREGWVAWRQTGRKRRVQKVTPSSLKGPVDDVEGSTSAPLKGPLDDGPYIEEPLEEPLGEPSSSMSPGGDVEKFLFFLSDTFDEPRRPSYAKTQIAGAEWLLINVPKAELRDAVEWAASNHFWATRARSAGKLKQAWPDLRAAWRAAGKSSPATSSRRSNREALAARAEAARKRREQRQ